MIEYWREFRVSGAPNNHGEGLTLEIHHGGHFMDVGNERFEYEGGERCWVESIDPDKFSWIELNTFTWRLGYREPPMFYWFKHPIEYVFLPIDDDKDIVKMLELMTKSRTLEVYCMGGGMRQIQTCEMEELTPNFGDIIQYSEFKNEVRTFLLYVVGYNGTEKKNSQSDIVVEAVEDGTNVDNDELFDSDYEIMSEDDLEFGEFRDTIDDQDFIAHVGDGDIIEEYGDMGLAGEISEHSYDTLELCSLRESSDEDEGDGEASSKMKKKKKIIARTWVPERDLKNPHFEVGLVFSDPSQFRDAIKKISLKNGYDLTFQKNTYKKFEVICGKKKGKKKDRPCPFWIYASCISKESTEVSIKSLHLEHKNCPIVERVRFCTATLIAKEYSHVFKNDPYISRMGFQDRIRDDYGQNITHRQVIRARKLASKLNEGSEEDQYNMLESYGVMLRETNPNSTVKMLTEVEGNTRKFKRFYVCFDACKRGWKEGCRPVIGLDACHIKNNYPGQLLSAVGIDANNGMYPIAFAIAESENRDTWTWFMEYLSVDLKISNGNGVMFMSDKQKGLLNAVADVVPEAEHRHCVCHLHNNFKKENSSPILKNLLWTAARDSTTVSFNKRMKEMGNISNKVVDWLKRHDTPHHWSRAFFGTEYKCDMLLNNFCESYNAAIIPCRDKPILVMLEQLRQDIMIRLANRRVAGMKWKADVGPRIQKLIAKNAVKAREYYGYRASDSIFEVVARSGGALSSKHCVDLAKKTCTCRRWMMSGIPCPHSICCIFLKGHEVIDYVDDCYSKKAYMNSYAHPINPVPGIELWLEIHASIHPPLFRRQPGRPKRARRREQDEEPPTPNVGAIAAGTTKMPRRLYVTSSCNGCSSKHHNRRTCPIEISNKAVNAAEGQKIGTFLPKHQTKQVANEQIKRSINQKMISKPTAGASSSQP